MSKDGKKDEPRLDESLCKNEKHIRKHLEAYKEYIRNPTHVCAKCGRAARVESLLCRPEPLA